jgi:hypothetical protein
MRTSNLEVHARAEEGEKCGCGEQRGPENFAASGFLKGDARDDPELRHRP